MALTICTSQTPLREERVAVTDNLREISVHLSRVSVLVGAWGRGSIWVSSRRGLVNKGNRQEEEYTRVKQEVALAFKP